MIRIAYERESVSLGDDAGSGEYTVELPDTAVLKDLMQEILHGKTRPLPYTGADSFWVIRSDSGNLADIYTGTDGEWRIVYLSHPEHTPLKPLGLAKVFAVRGLDPKDQRSSYNGYEAASMTGKEIREFLADAYERMGPYDKPVRGERIRIAHYKKIQDDRTYPVYYSDSFFKIMDAETGKSLYFITYMK